jgi:hypothetical protein
MNFFCHVNEIFEYMWQKYSKTFIHAHNSHVHMFTIQQNLFSWLVWVFLLWPLRFLMIMWFSFCLNSFNMDQLFGCSHHKNLWHLWYQILSSFFSFFWFVQNFVISWNDSYNFCLFVMFIHMCLFCVVLWSTTNYNSHWNHHICLLRVVVLLIGLLAQVNDHGWCSLETIEDKLHLIIN